MRKRVTTFKTAGVALLVAGVLGLAACAPQGPAPSQPASDDKPAATAEEPGSSTSTEAPTTATAAEAEVAENGVPVSKPVLATPVTNPDRPVVIEYPDGTLVQRTPTEDSKDTPKYNKPEMAVPSNIANLNADAKGCNACHPDLGELVYNMSLEGGRYDH